MNLEEYIAEREQRDPEFREAMEASRSAYEFRRALIKARLDSGLTRAELAARIGMKQPAIARLGDGESDPTLGTIMRPAHALGASFEVLPTFAVETHSGRATA